MCRTPPRAKWCQSHVRSRRHPAPPYQDAARLPYRGRGSPHPGYDPAVQGGAGTDRRTVAGDGAAAGAAAICLGPGRAGENRRRGSRRQRHAAGCNKARIGRQAAGRSERFALSCCGDRQHATFITASTCCNHRELAPRQDQVGIGPAIAIPVARTPASPVHIVAYGHAFLPN